MQKGKNNLLAFVVFCLIILFFSGCVEVSDYVYKREVPELPEEEVIVKDPEKVEEEEEEWIGSFLDEDSLTKECPVCQRRYRSYQERCPYDEAELIER